MLCGCRAMPQNSSVFGSGEEDARNASQGALRSARPETRESLFNELAASVM